MVENEEKRETEEKRQEKRFARKPQQAKGIISASGKEVRGIVRLAGFDLKGTLPIRRAVVAIRGIGMNLGSVISKIAYKELGANEKTMIGELSEQDVEKLENIMRNPLDYGVPARMLNRQKDLLTGKDMHYIGSDLAYAVKQDIDHEKDIYSWRGYRHTYGQKVRGQRTRSTGRTGMTVGVIRKSVVGKAGEAAAQQAQQASAAKAGAKPSQPAAKAKAAPPKKEEPKK